MANRSLNMNSESKFNPLIIIAGASGSGKSTLAKELSLRLSNFQVLNEDDFCFDRSFLLDRNSFYSLNHDLPSVVEHALAYSCLSKLLTGVSVEIPKYEHRTLSRSYGAKMNGGGGLIYEGLHVLHDSRIRALASFTVFLTCNYETLAQRRLDRDRVSRGVCIDDPAEAYYKGVALPSYEKHVEPLKPLADCLLDGECPKSEMVSIVLDNYAKKNSLC